jgi:hypothetical protein
MEQLLPYFLSISGAAIILLMAAVSWFVSAFIKDSKLAMIKNTADIAELKSKGASSYEKHDGDIRLLTRETELQIQAVNKNVDRLAGMIETVFEKAVQK